MLRGRQSAGATDRRAMLWGAEGRLKARGKPAPSIETSNLPPVAGLGGLSLCDFSHGRETRVIRYSCKAIQLPAVNVVYADDADVVTKDRGRGCCIVAGPSNLSRDGPPRPLSKGYKSGYSLKDI